MPSTQTHIGIEDGGQAMSDGNGGQGFPQGLIKRVQGGLAKLHQNHHRKQ